MYYYLLFTFLMIIVRQTQTQSTSCDIIITLTSLDYADPCARIPRVEDRPYFIPFGETFAVIRTLHLQLHDLLRCPKETFHTQTFGEFKRA